MSLVCAQGRFRNLPQRQHRNPLVQLLPFPVWIDNPQLLQPQVRQRCARRAGGTRRIRDLSATGSASGPYDQERGAWVLLLQGRAVLEVEGGRVALTAGEALWLPAHRVHSVLDTSDDPPCVWLAVHIDPA